MKSMLTITIDIETAVEIEKRKKEQGKINVSTLVNSLLKSYFEIPIKVVDKTDYFKVNNELIVLKAKIAELETAKSKLVTNVEA